MLRITASKLLNRPKPELWKRKNPYLWPRACLKNAFCKMCITIYGIFCLHSVAVARYAALIQAKSPANCDAHLAESIFQTRSGSKGWMGAQKRTFNLPRRKSQIWILSLSEFVCSSNESNHTTSEHFHKLHLPLLLL